MGLSKAHFAALCGVYGLATTYNAAKLKELLQEHFAEQEDQEDQEEEQVDSPAASSGGQTSSSKSAGAGVKKKLDAPETDSGGGKKKQKTTHASSTHDTTQATLIADVQAKLKGPPKITQADAASAMGVNPTQLSQWFNGKATSGVAKTISGQAVLWLALPTAAPAPAQDAGSSADKAAVQKKKLTADEGSGKAKVQKTAAAVRMLQTSNFLDAYHKPENKPEYFDQLMAAVRALILAHALTQGIAQADAKRYFETVQKNAGMAGGLGEMLDKEKLMHIAVRLWTTAEKLGGSIELCAILNAAIRSDEPATIAHVATISHAINAHCVTRRLNGSVVRWPAENTTYRGGAMPRMHQSFFVTGKQYRAPMFLATSSDEYVSVDTFMKRLAPASASQSPPHQEPILWIFHFDSKMPQNRRCVNVNFIDKNDGTVGNEDEFLFPPYSVFTVRSVRWDPKPLATDYVVTPHRIELDVAPDNSKEPLDLPLAPWC